MSVDGMTSMPLISFTSAYSESPRRFDFVPLATLHVKRGPCEYVLRLHEHGRPVAEFRFTAQIVGFVRSVRGLFTVECERLSDVHVTHIVEAQTERAP